MEKLVRFYIKYSKDDEQLDVTYKVCKKPEQTKVFKGIVNLFDIGDIESFGYEYEYSIHNGDKTKLNKVAKAMNKQLKLLNF